MTKYIPKGPKGINSLQNGSQIDPVKEGPQIRLYYV